jgi:hypothetical protein
MQEIDRIAGIVVGWGADTHSSRREAGCPAELPGHRRRE